METQAAIKEALRLSKQNHKLYYVLQDEWGAYPVPCDIVEANQGDCLSGTETIFVAQEGERLGS